MINQLNHQPIHCMKRNLYPLVLRSVLSCILLFGVALSFAISQEMASSINAGKIGSQPHKTESPEKILRIITGIVTDEAGDPLIGASIKGGNKGTVTDINGKFSIDVSDEVTVLVVSYTGYETQEVRIGASSSLNIVMTESGINLNDVVVIGSRNQTRTKIETPVPVDVIPIQEVR